MMMMMMMMVSFFISSPLSRLIVWMEYEMVEEEEDTLKDNPQRAYSRFSGLDVKLTCFDVEYSEDFTPMSSQ